MQVNWSIIVDFRKLHYFWMSGSLTNYKYSWLLLIQTGICCHVLYVFTLNSEAKLQIEVTNKMFYEEEFMAFNKECRDKNVEKVDNEQKG